jgi:flavin reductase (DIM6/NTAB) family NADH-FMN oxidoreductase RutF
VDNSFKKVTIKSVQENPCKLLDNDWALLTAGSIESFNTMTVSWGGFGVLWDRNICYCFSRPHRYTYEFLEKSGFFTLSFFEEKHRSVLDFCGSHSGRDTDKIAETGITPVSGDPESAYFSEARLVYICRKIYYQDLIPEHFLDRAIHEHYPDKDYHRMYIGEIVSCLKKD